MSKRRTKEDCAMLALKYDSRNSFKKGEYGAYQSARRNGWLDEICNHMILKCKTHTKAECEAIASEYKTRNDFKINDNAIYAYSLKYNWLNDICKHMKPQQMSRTKAECLIISKQYETRIDFCRNENAVYYYAIQNGWLDDICSHMKRIYPCMDALYLWKVLDNPIWKIGICNCDNVRNRIEQVATIHDLEIESVIYIVDKDCRKKETMIKKLGTPRSVFQIWMDILNLKRLQIMSLNWSWSSLNERSRLPNIHHI